MKKILLILFCIVASTITYADATLAISIVIKNQGKIPIVLSGWSLGCGPPQESITSIHSEPVEGCYYDNELYYEFNQPASIIMPGQSTNASLINYKKSDAFGRLGIQYSQQQIEKIGCGLVIDLNGDIATQMNLNPMFPKQSMTCDLTSDGKNLLVEIK